MAYRQIWFEPRSSKYKAESQNYGGKWYRSKFEASYAMNLDWRLKAKEIQAWEYEPRISLDVNGVHITNYFPDFKITNADGSVEYHETKGFETADWKIKCNLFVALLQEIDPGAEYYVIKERKRKYGRFGKTKKS